MENFVKSKINPYKHMASPSLPHSFLHHIPDEVIFSKKIIIVGGGYAGVKLASIMKHWGVPFILIDPKDYFFVNLAALRAVLYPDFTENIMIPYAPTFGEHFIKGYVTNVDFDKKEVSLSSEAEGPFSYTHLIIAVGSKGPFPGKSDAKTQDDVTKSYSDVASEIDKSTDIVIIGGGPVGVELAGEIAERYSSKFVTLIHPSKALASKRYTSNGFQSKIKKKLKQFTVEVVQGRVNNLTDLTFATFMKQTVQTEENEYPCDIVLNCTGLSPERNLTNKIFDDEKFDRHFRLRVTPELKVEGFDDVFAIGDCCNTDEEKLAIHAENHAECIAHNILREMENEEPKPYTTQFDGMFLSLGSRNGAGVFNGWSVPSWIVSLLRSRSLQYPKYWELMEQKEPDYDF